MEEEKQQRGGKTVITSVSVSKEFQKLLDQYNLSPTECFRRGVAVTLFDLGVEQYKTKLNEARSDYVREFMDRIVKEELLQREYYKIVLFENIKSNLKAIKKIIKDIEDE